MTRRRKPAEGADIFQTIKQQVAVDLKAEANSELVRHVASLRLIRENAVATACRGERVPVADIVALDSALKAYLPRNDGLQISVSYVEGVQGVYTCKCCGEKNVLAPGSYEPIARPERRTAAAPVDVPAPVPAPSTATATPEPAPAVNNVVPLIDYSPTPRTGNGYDAFAWSGHPLPTPGGI